MITKLPVGAIDDGTDIKKTLISVNYALYCLMQSKFERQTSDYKIYINNRL